MITAIELKNFKRFRELQLDIRQLTVLTGLNGSGKSTVVQGLLLAHQAALLERETVPLVGYPGLDLGYSSDVHCLEALDSEVAVKLTTSKEFSWVFDAAGSTLTEDPFLRIISQPIPPPSPIGDSGRNFNFLSAERIGPRTSHPTEASRPEDRGVGEDGRFTAHILTDNERSEVPAERRHQGAGNVKTLVAQTEAWMSTLVGRIQFDATLVPRTSIATLRIRTPNRMGEWMLPTNTGFGVSYSLPVIVAGLTAVPGGLLIVDSPEAHLHPSAQSAMGVFLATIAASGVQVILETHSDHVLNGIRLAIGEQHIIDAADVQILFFGEDDPVELKLTNHGSIKRWPPGFFDQIERDLGKLTKIRFEE